MTPDLICLSTYQLLWSPSSDFGPDVSFDMSVSPDPLPDSARAILAEVSMLRLFSRLSRETIPLRIPPVYPSGDFGPDVSFDMSVSPDPLPDSARAILAEVSMLRLFSRLSRETIPLLRRLVLLCQKPKYGGCLYGRWSFKPKEMEKKLFLIDLRAILDYLTWRHSHSCVSDDLPVDGYNQNDVERLCVRLIRLRKMNEEVLVRSGLSSVCSNRKCNPVFRRKDDKCEMSIFDFMTHPSWGDAKVVEEPHHFPAPLLDHVPQHTTAAAAEGPSKRKAQISSIVASKPTQPSKKMKLRKKVLEVRSSYTEVEQTKSLGDADISNFWVELEGSLERSC
ncbi:hypothetical protein Tco_0695419 [Tanacetum coccineum]